MGLLSNVAMTAPPMPSRMVMYAAEKFGKTSFACHAIKPIVLMTAGETGLLSLLESGRVPPTPHIPDEFRDWRELRSCVRALQSEEHDYRTLILDTGNGAENLCVKHVCDNDYRGEWSDYQSYGKGDAASSKEWASFLGQLDDLRSRRKLAILLLHHARVKTFNNPTGKDWDQWRPESVDKLWSLTHKWADVIMFGGFKVTLQKDKAVGESRYLRCTASGAIVAGNRYGLPDEITAPPGADKLWAAFAAAMKKAKGQRQPDPPNGPINTDVVSLAQAKQLRDLIERSDTTVETFLKSRGVERLEQFPAAQYESATSDLMREIDAARQAREEAK